MSKYSSQFKLSAITAYLERGYGFRFVAELFQMDPTLLRRWVEAYQLHGEASLQRRPRHFGPDFKFTVLQRLWSDQLSFRQAAVIFNLGNSTQVGIWQEQYYSGGFEALASGHKGARIVMPKPPAKPPESAPVNDEDLSHAELLVKLRKLQVENAVLKKLKELREEKKRQELAAKKKRS